MLRRANKPQRARFWAAGSDLSLPSSDQIPTDQAVTPFIERLPFPELIEPSQRVQPVASANSMGVNVIGLILCLCCSAHNRAAVDSGHRKNTYPIENIRIAVPSNAILSTRDVVRFFPILRSVKIFEPILWSAVFHRV
jgi:hypothetical protein